MGEGSAGRVLGRVWVVVGLGLGLEARLAGVRGVVAVIGGGVHVELRSRGSVPMMIMVGRGGGR